MSKHTISDLYQMQSMPLNIKVRMTQNRIRGWVDEYGEDGVYVSFSGGKDSTVLLDIVRKMYPGIVAVFVDTGLEYPEIRDFVKTFDNVEWLKPKKTFRQVIEEYGYPFISKEVSERVYGARRYLEKLRERESYEVMPYSPHTADLMGIDRRENPNNQEYLNLKKGNIPRYDPEIKSWWRYVSMTGEINQIYGKKSQYDYSKYLFMVNAPFETSNKCCSVMKKTPVHSYAHKTGRHPITAQMASESRVRTQQWLKNGCNGFDMKEPISNPMSFWTEQDVLLYIKENNLPICSVYGEIVEVEDKEVSIKDQDVLELFDIDRTYYRTTGCQRTGCMFCGYGCHLEEPGEGRFLKMKETHPKQYDYIMRPKEKGGLNYKEVIDWINEHGGFHIEY